MLRITTRSPQAKNAPKSTVCHYSVFTCFISRSSLQTHLSKNDAILRKFVFGNVFFHPSLFRATRVVCKETARKIHRWCAYVLFFIHKFWIGHWYQFMAKRWADVPSCAVSRLFWICTCWKLPWRTSQGKFSLDIMSRLISRGVFLTPSLVDESRKPCHDCTGICKKETKNAFHFSSFSAPLTLNTFSVSSWEG